MAWHQMAPSHYLCQWPKSQMTYGVIRLHWVNDVNSDCYVFWKFNACLIMYLSLVHIDGIMQDWGISSASALLVTQSCANFFIDPSRFTQDLSYVQQAVRHDKGHGQSQTLHVKFKMMISWDNSWWRTMERQRTEMTISINWSVQLLATYQWFLRKPPSVHVVELAGRPRHYNVTSPGTGWLNRSHWASWRTCDRIRYDIDGLVQNCSISNALALEILQSCT